jgi:phosphoglycolate phosphatase
MKLLLFDIDGTLLLSGGAGFRAIDRVLLERFGVAHASRGILPDGKTDPVIFREVLAACGIPGGELARAMEVLTVDYERCFREEMPVSPGARLMPGVEELLAALAIRSEVVLGLLTGNLERTARVKLERFGLNRYFRFGAFSSDDEVRERLVPLAVERAERLTGHRIGLGRHVHVIGDTPRDIVCALANGVTAVGVGAARYPARDLAAAGAHVVFESLADTEAVLAGLELGHG